MSVTEREVGAKLSRARLEKAFKQLPGLEGVLTCFLDETQDGCQTDGCLFMIGQRLGRYRIVEKIGAGGMGEVYRAYDDRLERDVAIKVLPVGTVADENARKRFHKEALALSKLNHANIGTVHDFDSQGGVDFLVNGAHPRGDAE